MRVDLYHVDQATDVTSVEALDVELVSCFPDDPQAAESVEAAIVTKGFAMYGGGATPLWRLEEAATK